MAKKSSAPKQAEVEAKEDVAEEVVASPAKRKSPDDIVSINVPVPLKIKRQVYYGVCKVPRHMVDTIKQMVDAKQRADLAVFTGKNFNVQRLADRTLVIEESERKE